MSIPTVLFVLNVGAVDMGAQLQLRTDIPVADFLHQARWRRLVRHCIEPRANLQLLVPAQAFELELLESDADRRAYQEDSCRVHEVLPSEFITEQRRHIQNALDTCAAVLARSVTYSLLCAAVDLVHLQCRQKLSRIRLQLKVISEVEFQERLQRLQLAPSHRSSLTQ